MTTKINSTSNPVKQRSSRKGSVITTAGAPAAPAAADALPPRLIAPTALPTSSNLPSKSATVLKLLGRTKGATIAEIGEPTGWQLHSTRAYLSGLRKKGLTIICEQRRTGETTYRIVDAASATVDAVVTLAADAVSPASSTSTEADGTAADKTDDAAVLIDSSVDAGTAPEAIS